MGELDQLQTFCDRHGIVTDGGVLDRFETFLDLLERFNGKMNLIGPMERTEVVDSLFCDSLVVGVVTTPRGAVLDVGSGAGFPGFPLAIVWPTVQFTLVEPRRKRSQFLEIARRRLHLDNVEVIRARIEEVEPALFDVVCSKAFQPPAEWVQTAAEWCKPDGTVVALHAADAYDEMVASASEVGLEVSKHVDDVHTLGLARANVVRSATAFISQL